LSTKYLLDTSALYPLIIRLREKLLLYENRFVILDLTIYEIGNTIWKEYKRGSIKDLALVVDMFKEIIKNLEKLNIGQKILEVLEIAKKNNITFYDASYIYVAKEYKLKLVTEDLDLLKFPETISLEAMLKELKI